MPKRIQRKRTKGWRMPPNTVSVTRPGRFGNPFTREGCREAGYVGTDDEIAERCVEAYRAWLTHPDGWINWQGPEADERKQWILDHLPELRSKNLACFCPLDRSCHADVLLDLANAS